MLIHFVNESRRNDAWLSQGCKELREHVDYFDSLPQQGHVTDDMWQVECILDERGAGKKREHLVRWTGFGPSALVVPTHLLVSLARVHLVKVNTEYRGLGRRGAPTPLLKVRAGGPYRTLLNPPVAGDAPHQYRK